MADQIDIREFADYVHERRNAHGRIVWFVASRLKTGGYVRILSDREAAKTGASCAVGSAKTVGGTGYMSRRKALEAAARLYGE